MLRRTKATLRAALMSTILVLTGANAQYDVPKDLPAVTPSPVVAILTPPNGWGSAVAVKQVRRGHPRSRVRGCYEEFLTAAHIVSQGANLGEDASPELNILVWNGKEKVPAALLYWQPRFDLALVAIDNEECLAKYAVPVMQGYLPAGMQVRVVGYLNAMGPATVLGTVTTYDTGDFSYDPNAEGPFLVHTAHTYSGMSGGPVMYRGMLVGMSLAVDQTDRAFNIASPAWRIRQFLSDFRRGARYAEE